MEAILMWLMLWFWIWVIAAVAIVRLVFHCLEEESTSGPLSVAALGMAVGAAVVLLAFRQVHVGVVVYATCGAAVGGWAALWWDKTVEARRAAAAPLAPTPEACPRCGRHIRAGAVHCAACGKLVAH